MEEVVAPGTAAAGETGAEHSVAWLTSEGDRGSEYRGRGIGKREGMRVKREMGGKKGEVKTAVERSSRPSSLSSAKKADLWRWVEGQQRGGTWQLQRTDDGGRVVRWGVGCVGRIRTGSVAAVEIHQSV